MLEAGDAIFYPNDYWHQTLNMDTPTVAVTGTIVTPECHSFVSQELMKECGKCVCVCVCVCVCQCVCVCVCLYELMCTSNRL